MSNRCEYALYDAAAQLERAVAALTYVANECNDDLEKYCSLSTLFSRPKTAAHPNSPKT